MAERVQGLSIGLNLDNSGIDRSLSEVKRSFKGLNASIKTNSNNLRYGEKSISSYEQNISTLNGDIEKQRKNLDDVGQKYKEAAAGGNENSIEAQKLSEEYNKQADNLNRLEHQLGSYTSELEEMKRQQEIANSGWTKTGEKLQSTGDKMSAVGGKVSGFGKKWTKVTGIIAGAVTGAGAAIFGLTNKITENAFEIRNQAAEMGVSTDAYQEMDYWAEQNGVSQQQMQKAVGRLNQRIGQAKDGNEKYQDALEGVGISMEDVRDGTLSTEDAFTESIKNLSEMDDKQERVGKATELFGTRMARQLQPALEDGAISMDEAREKAEELGVVMSEDEIEASADFQASMVDIKASLSSVGREIGISVMPYMQKFADYMMDHMPQIKETVSNAFQSVVGSVKSVVNWFQELEPSIQKGVAVFGAIVAAIGPVSIALGGLMKVFGPIITSVGKLFTVFGKLGGLLPAIKVAFTALTGPIGITVGIVAGLVAGFVTAYKKSETFRNIINGLKDAFMNAISGIKQFLTTNPQIQAFIDSVEGGFKAVWDTVKSVFGSIASFIQSQITKIKAFWDENGTQLLEAFRNIFNGIWAVVKPIINKIKNIFEVTFPVIKDIVTSVFTTVLDVVENVWNTIKGVISGATEVIMGTIKTFASLFTGDWEGMWDGIKQIASGVLKVIKSIIKGAWTTIKTVTETIWGGIKGFFSTIWKGIKTVFKTVIKFIVRFARTRWENFRDNVKAIFKGIKSFFSTIWSGIKTVFKTVIKAIVNFAKNWWENFNSNIRSIFKGIKKFFSSIWKGIKSIFTSVIKSVVRFVKKRFKGMKSTITTIWEGIKKVTKSAWDGVKKFIINPVKSGVKWALDKFGAFKKKVSDIFGNIKEGVGDKISAMIQFVKDMPGKMKSAVKKGAGAVKNGFLTIARKIVDGIAAGVNGLRKGVKWALDKIGMGDKVWGKFKPEDKLGWYAKGTKGHPNNSPAVVGDGKGSNSGSELITRPNGQSYMSPSKPTIMPMEKGTQVTPAKLTKQMLSSTPRYALGTDIWEGIKTGGKKAWEGTKTGGKKAWGGIKKGGESLWKGAEFVGSKAKEGASHLLNKGLKKMGVNIPSAAKTMGHFYKGTFDKLKGWSLDYIKDKLSDFNEKYITGIDGDMFGKNFTKTSDYGNRSDPMGGGTTFHKGVDFAADKGTPIEALLGGKVIHAGEGEPGSGYNGYGKSVVLRVGDHDHLYGHMSKVYSKKGQDIKKGGSLGEVGATGQATGNHVHFEVRKKGTMQTVDPNELFGEPAPDASGKGVKRWKSTVKKALKKNNLSTSGSMVNKVLRQISTESGGNPKAIQGSDVMDVNMAAGNPARGLMQTIPTTFMAYKHKGHGNIMKGYDNLLASLAYAKSRYGSNLSGLGEGHGYEKGTNYVPENQWAYLHKGEKVTPAKHNNQEPTQAMKLLALVGKALKSETQTDTATSFGDNDLLEVISEKLDKQNELLRKILLKDNNMYLDGKELAEGLSKPLENIRNKQGRRDRRAEGRV